MIAFAILGTSICATIMLALVYLKLLALDRRASNNRLKIDDVNEILSRINRRIIDVNDTLCNLRRDVVKGYDDIMDRSCSNLKTADAVFAVVRGMNDNTYRVFTDLIAAVENNDVGKLSDVVRSARHMCLQYETAGKAFSK